jgi:hypothetical protein
MLYDGHVGGSLSKGGYNMETRISIGVLLIAASFLIPALFTYTWLNFLGVLLIAAGVFLVFYDVLFK